jgi:hemerythrin-like domain-containing protein
MATIIDLLREEHRDINKLLTVLEQELAVFDRQERPDYDVIQAAIAYFQDYPDCCHHPKEDMIFEKLKARDPIAAERVGDVKAEHRHEAERLEREAKTVRNILLDQDISRQAFGVLMRDFIGQQRTHMRLEERVLFPAAVNTLSGDDWAAIGSQWADRKDSLFNVAMEEKCSSLRDRVLQWAGENRERAQAGRL